MEIESSTKPEEAPTGAPLVLSVEASLCAELFFSSLYLYYLFDKQRFAEGQKISSQLIELIQRVNSRSLDNLAAKIYYLYGRFYEATTTETYQQILPTLLSSFRLATVRGDIDCQAELTNLVLRHYINFNLYDSADKFVRKISFPVNAANNQFARYMYYLGRISSILLEYNEASKYLQNAIRKASRGKGAAGFQQAANKLHVIVQLLMGEIPEKSLFLQPVLKKSLEPYFELTKAVRSGDLVLFQNVLIKYEATFQRDKTWTLALRLRHNVIRAGLRLISKAYSRISFVDISEKLRLESPQDAEFIVTKALKDKIVQGRVDHSLGCFVVQPLQDIYRTKEPELAFEQRTSFCLSLYDEALKAMRYPEDLQSKKDWKSARRHQLKDFSSENNKGEPKDGDNEDDAAADDASFDDDSFIDDDLEF